jgi:hypothetical protein
MRSELVTLQYLQKLELESLPLTVTCPGAIRSVELLAAALLIHAKVERRVAGSPPQSAVVYSITQAGRVMLEHHRPEPSRATSVKSMLIGDEGLEQGRTSK